jgi:hypothetical protein
MMHRNCALELCKIPDARNREPARTLHFKVAAARAVICLTRPDDEGQQFMVKAAVVRHMSSVEDYRARLASLQGSWDTL